MALWLADIQHSRNTHLAAHGILGTCIYTTCEFIYSGKKHKSRTGFHY